MQLIRTPLLATAVLASMLSAAAAQEVYVPNYDDQTVSVL